MTPVLVTERLVLRGIVADDAADLFAFRSDPSSSGTTTRRCARSTRRTT